MPSSHFFTNYYYLPTYPSPWRLSSNLRNAEGELWVGNILLRPEK
jgi:hypothetical protein